MRIAYYSPMKVMEDPVPSGDRRMARLFFDALKAAGHEPYVASALTTFDGIGNRKFQATVRRQSAAIAKHIIAAGKAIDATPPALWFTYHLYHKAPDWIGPAVARGLGIPYVVAEASIASKRETGPWATGYDAALKAALSADLILAMTEPDEEGLRDVLGPTAPIYRFTPFIDFHGPANERARRAARVTLARSFSGLEPAAPWLLTVAMMREGKKADNYTALGRALKSLSSRYPDQDWQLVVVGDGPARGDVEAGFWDLPPKRIAMIGEASPAMLDLCFLTADLFVWPGCGEAYGVAYLEAAAAGIPAVACDDAGVPEVVHDGETGRLVPPGDPDAFADAIAELLASPKKRAALATGAFDATKDQHGFTTAVETLQAILPDPGDWLAEPKLTAAS